MAGHSKWANIQHRKKAQDSKRGKLFTKLIRAITVAARMGGADIESNPRLRDAVNKALAGNMTRDTIDRAIKRGVGDQDGAAMEEIRYEGYGPNGVAIMVDCMTDNRNRTVADVRHLFSKHGGNLGTDGSVAYMFTKQGIMTFEPGTSEEAIMEAALEAGADDIVTQEDGSIDVVTTPEQFEAVREALTAADLTPAMAEVTMNPETRSELDEESAETLTKLIDALEDLDDVQEVYNNAEFPE